MGGCIKSLKGPRASFSAELTSDEEHVMHSTRVGYRAITWAHVLPSTAGGKQKNTEEEGKRSQTWERIGGRERGQNELWWKSFSLLCCHMEMTWLMQTSWRAQKRNFREPHSRTKPFFVIDLAGNTNSSPRIGDKTLLKKKKYSDTFICNEQTADMQ